MYSYPSISGKHDESIDLTHYGSSPTQESKEAVLIKDLGDLLTSHELADVKLICRNGEPIMAHKAILAARSQYFSQLFKESMQYLEQKPMFAEKGGQETDWKPTSTAAIDIAPTRPSNIESAPYIVHKELMEEISEPSSPSKASLDAKWGHDSDETLAEISLHSPSPSATVPPSSKPSAFKPTPYPHVPTPIPPKKTVRDAVPARLSMRSPTDPECRVANGILEIVLRHVEYEAMSPIVSYLYTMQMDVTIRNLVPVYLLSHDLGLSTLKPEILNAAKTMYTVEAVLQILKASTGWPQCKPIMESIFSWLNEDLSRSRVLLHSPHFSELPFSTISQMVGLRLFPDEYEVYERFCEISSGTEKGGEADQLLKSLNFQRMTPEQLLNVHKLGRVKDRVILEAFKAKVVEGVFSPRSRSGTCVLLEVTLFGRSSSSPLTTPHHPQQPHQYTYHQRLKQAPKLGTEHASHIGLQHNAPSQHHHYPIATASTIGGGIPVSTSSSSNEHIASLIPSASVGSRTAISGLSPATLMRRRSVAVTVPDEGGAGGDTATGSIHSPSPFVDTETWHSEPFQVHNGNWSAIIKTRGGTIYKAGMTLNHTTSDCQSITLENWSLGLDLPSTTTAPPQGPFFVDFSTTKFQMGTEIFKPVDIATSTALGFSVRQHSFKKPPKATLYVRVQFPIPSKIHCRDIE